MGSGLAALMPGRGRGREASMPGKWRAILLQLRQQESTLAILKQIVGGVQCRESLHFRHLSL